MTRRPDPLATDEALKSDVLAILRRHGMGDFAGRAAWPDLAMAFEGALKARAAQAAAGAEIIHPKEWR